MTRLHFNTPIVLKLSYPVTWARDLFFAAAIPTPLLIFSFCDFRGCQQDVCKIWTYTGSKVKDEIILGERYAKITRCCFHSAYNIVTLRSFKPCPEICGQPENAYCKLPVSLNKEQGTYLFLDFKIFTAKIFCFGVFFSLKIFLSNNIYTGDLHRYIQYR